MAEIHRSGGSGSAGACQGQVAPISTNLILSCVAEHLLDMPRSF